MGPGTTMLKKLNAITIFGMNIIAFSMTANCKHFGMNIMRLSNTTIATQPSIITKKARTTMTSYPIKIVLFIPVSARTTVKMTTPTMVKMTTPTVMMMNTTATTITGLQKLTKFLMSMTTTTTLLMSLKNLMVQLNPSNKETVWKFKKREERAKVEKMNSQPQKMDIDYEATVDDKQK